MKLFASLRIPRLRRLIMGLLAKLESPSSFWAEIGRVKERERERDREREKDSDFLVEGGILTDGNYIRLSLSSSSSSSSAFLATVEITEVKFMLFSRKVKKSFECSSFLKLIILTTRQRILVGLGWK